MIEHVCRVTEVDTFSILMKGRSNVNAFGLHGDRPLHLVAERGQLERHDILRAWGADHSCFNDDGVTAPEILRARHESDVINQSGTPALHAACKDGLKFAGQDMIDAGIDVESQDRKGRTPLLIAAEVFGGPRGNFERIRHNSVLKILLAEGANLDAQDQCGQTAVHIACRKKVFGRAIDLV